MYMVGGCRQPPPAALLLLARAADAGGRAHLVHQRAHKVGPQVDAVLVAKAQHRAVQARQAGLAEQHALVRQHHRHRHLRP